MELVSLALGIIVSIAVSAVFLTIYIHTMRKRMEKRVMSRVIKLYRDMLCRALEGLSEVCPTCAFHIEGCICDRPDYQNLCAYGKCTNFEERRY